MIICNENHMINNRAHSFWVEKRDKLLMFLAEHCCTEIKVFFSDLGSTNDLSNVLRIF